MRFSGFLIKLIFLFSFLVSLAAGSLFAYSISDTPIVTRHSPLSTQQIKKVKAFIKANNPAHFKAGEKRSTSITEAELNLFISHSLMRLNDQLRIKVRLFDSSAYITSSFKLPSNPLGNYLNVSTEVRKNDQIIEVISLEVGSIKIPALMANALLKLAHDEISSRFIEYQYAMNSITDFKLQKNQASINYIWNPAVARKIKDSIASQIIPPELHSKIVAYTRKLSTVTRTTSGRKPSLNKLLGPMFSHAIERSKNNNPVEENRALLITLGAHMLGKNIPLLLGDRSVEHIITRNYYLHNRNDLSKHLLISAALTAAANPAIAQAIGLEKEIDDSAGGSGFSFADLAADRAGIALANMGLASSKQARALQQRLARVQNESDFMPGINSLREGLQNIDFKAVYKHTDSAEYKRVIRAIDQRIARLAVYQ